MILVTGVTGFVGKAVVQSLLTSGLKLVAAIRQSQPFVAAEIDTLNNPQYHAVGAINGQTKWAHALYAVHTVVHCAARAHVMSEHARDALAAYREVNVDGTLNLAQQAAAAGVKRFVFISSIKVNGEATANGHLFSELDVPAPNDAYGQSKAEAEQALLALAAQTDMEVVIIRSPLVYGPGVKGNFAVMAKAMQRGLPLPLGYLHNKRSMIALKNLVSFIALCADRPRSPLAANQLFVLADGEDVSTTTLLRKLARAAGRPSRLLPVPAWLLRAGISLLGKRGVANRLLGNLQVDATKARTLLGWQPVVTMDQQLATMFAAPDVDDLSCGAVNAVVPEGVGAASFNQPLLRVIDVLLAGMGLLVLLPVLFLVCGLGWLDTRSPIFVQERVGRDQRPFVLVKFRTMRPGTASVASHLASSASITRIGAFLRRTKLDELPQLWNVLSGDMSLVGPRPCLFNQEELVRERAARKVFDVRPGITGLGQVQGLDMSNPRLLAETDQRMITEFSLRNYVKYIVLTVFGKGSGDRVRT